MAGLIEEIQRSASDDSIPVSQLLRRMKIAAVKLRLSAPAEWVEHELNGYPDKSKLPAYRALGGVPMRHHVIHGWGIWRLGDDERTNQLFLLNLFGHSIAEVEGYAVSTGPIFLSYPEFLERLTLPHLNAVSKIALSVDQGKFRAILSAVRNRALAWALAVEEAGVTGEGLSFTAEETKMAQTVNYNFYGDNSRVNHGSTDSSTNTVTGDG